MTQAKENSPFPQDLVSPSPSQICTAALIQDIKDQLERKREWEKGRGNKGPVI